MSALRVPRRWRELWRHDMIAKVLANCGARGLAIVGLALATVLVARAGGPSTVGSYALLRMLTGLAGVLSALGLPSALAFFLARHGSSSADHDDRSLWPTLMALLGAGSVLGTLAWVLATPLLAQIFFRTESLTTIAFAALAVGSQLILTVGKNCLQGLEDHHGGDVVIAAEELAFLPTYGAALLIGLQGSAAVVAGLVLADVLIGFDAWRRVSRRLGWSGVGLARAPRGWWGRPDLQLAREIAHYGLRGQVGGFMTLLNLRLDFAILGALAGPAVLGTYAVASKFAELLRLPGTALTWVYYPSFASDPPEVASRRARRLLRPGLIGVLAAVIPAGVLVAPVIHVLYGAAFDPAVVQARVLLVGMVLGGASGVASGYLYGRGRPGLNSAAMGTGLALTVLLDLLLIPSYGALGAAVASTIAYLSTDLVLIILLLRLSRPANTDAQDEATTLRSTPVTS